MVLSLLLEHGASIDGLDNLRRAPLHWAVIEKAVSKIIRLIDSYARGFCLERTRHRDFQ